MALEPITRQEKIIAGQDLTPITRMEMFLKNFGGGGGVTVDSELSDTSENPVQNKVIKSALDALRFDVPISFDYMTNTVSCPVTISEIVEKYQSGFYPVATIIGVFGEQSAIIGYSIGLVIKETEAVFYFLDALSSQAMYNNTYPLSIQTAIISNSGTTLSSAGKTLIKGLTLNDKNGIIMRSSTSESSKMFRITVDDSGTISATEVT